MSCESADGLFGDSIHFLYDSFPLPTVRGFRHHFAVLHGKQKRSLDAEPHVAFQRRIELQRNWNLPESVLRFRFFDARFSGIIELD